MATSSVAPPGSRGESGSGMNRDGAAAALGDGGDRAVALGPTPGSASPVAGRTTTSHGLVVPECHTAAGPLSDETVLRLTAPKATGGLGMTLRTVRDGSPQSRPRGVVVARVKPGSPAFRSGIRPGSILSSVAGASIEGKTNREAARLVRSALGVGAVTIGIRAPRQGDAESAAAYIATDPADLDPAIKAGRSRTSTLSISSVLNEYVVCDSVSTCSSLSTSSFGSYVECGA